MVIPTQLKSSHLKITSKRFGKIPFEWDACLLNAVASYTSTTAPGLSEVLTQNHMRFIATAKTQVNQLCFRIELNFPLLSYHRQHSRMNKAGIWLKSLC